MTRSHSISSTVVPVATLVLGIAIGWRLGPEPAFQSGQTSEPSGRATLAGSADGLFGSDPESGSPAEIGSLPDGVSSLDDDVVAESGDDAVQYFPEAVSAETVASSDGRPSPSPASAPPDDQKSVEQFDEEVWRAELTGLTDDQANELIEIRKQLGNVAAATLGVESDSFPSLADGSSGSSDEDSEPRLLTLPGDEQLRPAIELASGEGGAVGPTPRETLAVTAEDVPNAKVPSNPVIEDFRHAVEATLRINLRNQKTPGYRRTEIVVVGVGDSPKAVPYATDTDAGQAEEPRADAQTVAASEISWLTRLDARSGERTLTGNSRDVAIFGEGWLMVEYGERRCVTRTGLLCRTEDGRLGVRTREGPLPLVPEVRIPNEQSGWMIISEDGKVTIPPASDEGDEERTVLGRIVPVCFPNESALERLPSGLLVETAESGPAFEYSSAELQQGYLESSTVDPARERAAADELLRFADELESNR